MRYTHTPEGEKKETKKKGEGFIKAIRELIQLCTISKGIKQKKRKREKAAVRT